MSEKEYIERGALIAEYDRVHVGAPGGARKLMVEAPTADVATKAEIADEIFNVIAKMFYEKQRRYENSRQSGKARQMMVARIEVHKLHQKYKEARHD